MRFIDFDIYNKNLEKVVDSIKANIPDFKAPEFNFPSIDTGRFAPLSCKT